LRREHRLDKGPGNPGLLCLSPVKTLLVLAMSVFAMGSALAAEQVVDVALAEGRVPPERRTIQVTRGDEVVLRWTSDRAIALHLHGYDIEESIPAGGSATMRFAANIAGRFPVSEHRHGGGRERALLYLEVRP
jgi:hypothetical protein